MKKIIISVIFLLLIGYAGAQTISMETISFTGSFYNGTQSKLSLTGGEVISGSVQTSGSLITQGYEQAYHSWWTGKLNTSWRNILNWNGGPVPVAKTDVIVLPGQPFNCNVDTIAFCRSIKLRLNATVTVLTGSALKITH